MSSSYTCIQKITTLCQTHTPLNIQQKLQKNSEYNTAQNPSQQRERERCRPSEREREMTAVDEGARHSDRRIKRKRKRQTSILDFPIKCLICSLIPLLQKCICSDLQQLGYDMSLLMEEKHPCHVFRRCYKCGNGPSLLLIIKPKAGRAGDGDGYFQGQLISRYFQISQLNAMFFLSLMHVAGRIVTSFTFL